MVVRLLAGSTFFKAVQNMPIVGGDHVLTAASLPIRSQFVFSKPTRAIKPKISDEIS